MKEMKPNAKSMKARIRISKSLFMETGTSVAIIYEIAGFEEHQSVDTASLCKHLRFLLVSSSDCRNLPATSGLNSSYPKYFNVFVFSSLNLGYQH